MVKRNETYLENTKFSAYLFTFMILRNDYKTFLIFLSHRHSWVLCLPLQRNTAVILMVKCHFRILVFEEITKIGPEINIQLAYYPPLIITACANARYWHLFKDTGQTVKENHYIDYTSSWYSNENLKITNFMQGTIVTTICNKTCPVSLLPSFRSLINIST